MMTPIGREPTCALARRPAFRTPWIWSSVSRHNLGCASTWTSRQESGRPASADAASSASNSPGPKSELTCSTPRPARFMPVAMPRSSASRALSEGVKRPSRALCLVVRDVVKPMAPARSASSVRRAISAISRCVRHLFVVGAALAHDIEAQRAMWQLRRHVDCAAHRVERVEILREGLPVELHALAQHRAGDVLDAFHQVDQVGRLARPHRREAHAAIAEHRGGDAVPRTGRHERVPGRLAVIVGVDIDETRRDDQARGVDLTLARSEPGTDRGDFSVLHGNIGDPARRARAV